jgi:hypothetical protein
VPGLDRVERLPGASHWLHHDEHERVNQLFIDFYARLQVPSRTAAVTRAFPDLAAG